MPEPPERPSPEKTALGRVLLDDELTGPRGPDGRLRLRVPAEWLSEGARIELELPRMLACAGCDGGGCDGCGRSGAIETRGRRELAELLEIELPCSTQSVPLRLPRRGGLGEGELGRGLLLLTVSAGDPPSEGLTRLSRQAAAGLAHAEPGGGAGAAGEPAAAEPTPVWVWALFAAGLAFFLYVLLR
jgi:hypothetical protein